MMVVWDKRATEGRQNVEDYIFQRFGYSRMERFSAEVDHTVDMIKSYPACGPIDPLFADRQKEYRSIIVGGLSKMVYSTDDKDIRIVAFWDCRQEPETKNKEKEK